MIRFLHLARPPTLRRVVIVATRCAGEQAHAGASSADKIGYVSPYNSTPPGIGSYSLSLTHTHAHSLTHSLTHLFTHSLTHSLAGIAGSIHECVDYRFHPLIIKSLGDYVNQNEIKKSKAKIKSVNDLVYYAKVSYLTRSLTHPITHLFVRSRKYCNGSTLPALVIGVRG